MRYPSRVNILLLLALPVAALGLVNYAPPLTFATWAVTSAELPFAPPPAAMRNGLARPRSTIHYKGMSKTL
jgi:hypothetical protein